MDKKNMLRKTPFFWSRMGFGYDPTRIGADGKPIVFSEDFSGYRSVHDRFRDAGIKYHTTILHSGWVGDGRYDYSRTDETLYALLEGNPDIYYMPRVKLNVPPDWCRNHPEDTFVYYNGPKTAEEISALAETVKHDYLGMDSPTGYPSGNTNYVDDRPNTGGVIGLQSFSSLQWRKDAKETLERLIQHINEMPFAKQIIGYHIGFGMCAENYQWAAWGRKTLDHGDFGIGNKRRFIEFGRNKYGSDLLSAWGVEDESEIEVPSPELLIGPKSEIGQLFFENHKICADYYEFISNCTSEAIIDFCKTVKNHNLIAGAFYGYTYIYEAAYGGHCDIEHVMNSPYVDFLASPKGYYRSIAGEPGGEQGPSYSMNRKIAWLDEIDNPTHLSSFNRSAETMEETRTLLYREAIKNWTCGQGFWWMDLGDGWYSDNEIMKEIATITRLGEQINSAERKSISEILFVVDEYSLKHMAVSGGLSNALLYETQTRVRLSGASIDVLRFADLYDDEIDLSQYKLFIFANCFLIRKPVKLPENAICIWNYTPGIVREEFDLSHIRSVTGMSMKESMASRPALDMSFCRNAVMKQRGEDFPLMAICDEDGIEILERYDNNDIKTAKKNNHIIYAYPDLTTEDVRKIALEAGCYVPAPINCTVYADNRIAGFFPAVDVDSDVKVFGRQEHIKLKAKEYCYFLA